MLGEYLKKARGERTLGQISAISKIDKGYLSKIERGSYVPKADKLSILSDAYNVPFIELLAELLEINTKELKELMNKNNKEVFINSAFNDLSESQTAMLKCRLRQLFEQKYSSSNFATNPDFLENIEASSIEVSIWFSRLRDTSLNNKIPLMLKILNVNSNNLFDKMNIVISSKAEANAIQLYKIKTYENIDTFPIIVPGNIVFDKVAGLSLKSLKCLSTTICEQITDTNDECKPKINDDIAEEVVREIQKPTNTK